jgi:hypothetical protein
MRLSDYYHAALGLVTASGVSDRLRRLVDRFDDVVGTVLDVCADPSALVGGWRKTVVVTVHGSDGGFLGFSPDAGEASCLRYPDRIEIVFGRRLSGRASSANVVLIVNEGRWHLELECGAALKATMKRLDKLAQSPSVIKIPFQPGQASEFVSSWGAKVSVTSE